MDLANTIKSARIIIKHDCGHPRKEEGRGYLQRGCANSGPWILIGTAAQRIVVGSFLISTAVKIVTHCAVFFNIFLLVAAVHRLLGVVKYSIEFALQLTNNLIHSAFCQ